MWAACLLGLLLAGCGSSGYPPEAINPDVDACAVCNMSIIEEAYATQLIDKTGTAYKFDDIGCMIKFLQDEKGKKLEISDRYVRDEETMEWVHMEDAYYVYHPDNVTPMAYGVLSFSSKERAESYLQKLGGKGTVFSADELFAHDWDAVH